MVCSKCGAPLPAEALFCPNCGERTLISNDPDMDMLEDDLLLALLEEEEQERSRQKMLERQKQKELQQLDKEQVEEEEAEYRDARHQREAEQRKDQLRWEHQQQMKRRKTRNKLIVLVVVLVLIVSGISFYAYHYTHTSIEYLLGRADAAYDRKDYQNALGFVDRVLEIEPENIHAWEMEGEIAYFMLESDHAEEIFTHVLELDDEDVVAYEYLLKIYSEKNDYSSILALKDGVTDEDILALFDDYLVPTPQFDVEPGTYNEYLDVKITCSERNMTFYYTLDGTTPTKESDEYEDGVKIEEQGEIILTAISCDAYGHCSEEVSVKYTIELLQPETPVVSPDGGQFTYGSSITITAPQGTKIYYTWDGTDPTEESYEYTEPIWTPEGNNILSVVAIDEFGMVSDVLQCNFIYYPPLPVTPEPEADTTTDTTTEEVSPEGDMA